MAQEHNQQSHKRTQSTKAEQRGSESDPVVIKILPSPKSDADAKKEEDERGKSDSAEQLKQKTDSDLVNFTGKLADYTWLLFCVGVLQFGILIAQIVYISRQEKATKTIERAYVMISRVKIISDPESGRDATYIYVKAKNFGHTPASNIRCWVGLDAQTFPLTTSLTEQSAFDQRHVGVIAPGHSFEIRAELGMLENGNEIHTGTHALYVYGDFRYTDAFDRQHVTYFRYMRTGEYWSVDGKMAVCQDGNDAT